MILFNDAMSGMMTCYRRNKCISFYFNNNNNNNNVAINKKTARAYHHAGQFFSTTKLSGIPTLFSSGGFRQLRQRQKEKKGKIDHAATTLVKQQRQEQTVLLRKMNYKKSNSRKFGSNEQQQQQQRSGILLLTISQHRQQQQQIRGIHDDQSNNDEKNKKNNDDDELNGLINKVTITINNNSNKELVQLTENNNSKMIEIIEEVYNYCNIYDVKSLNHHQQKHQNGQEGLLLLMDGTYQLFELWLAMQQQQKQQQPDNAVGNYFGRLRGGSSSSTSNTSTNESKHKIFTRLLELFSMKKNYNNPIRANSILDNWNDLLGGDLELAPTIDHYNCLLCSYANNNTIGDIDGDNDIRDVAEMNAHKIGEIFQQLETSYINKPTIETYSYLCCSLAKVLRLRHPSFTSNNNRNNNTSHIHNDDENMINEEDIDRQKIKYCNDVWEAMRYAVEQILSKSSFYYKNYYDSNNNGNNSTTATARSSSNSINNSKSQTKSQQQQDCKINDAYFVTRALCDAIQCHFAINYKKNDWSEYNDDSDGEAKYDNDENDKDWLEWYETIENSLFLTNINNDENNNNQRHNSNNNAGAIFRFEEDGVSSPFYNHDPLQDVIAKTYYAIQRLIRYKFKDVEQMEQMLYALEQLEKLSDQYNKNSQQPLLLKLPASEHYKNVIDVFSKFGTVLSDATDKKVINEECIRLLQRMEMKHWERVYQNNNCHEAQEQPQLQPDTKTTKMWNHLLFATYRVGAPDRVVGLWKEMKKCNIHCDTKTYHVVLKALADIKKPDAAYEAHAILKNLVTTRNRRLVGGEAHNNIQINIDNDDDKNGNNDFVDKLKNMFDDVPKEEDYDNKYNIIEPTGQHYASVLIGWSRVNDTNAPKLALEVFNQLQIDYLNERQPTKKMRLLPSLIHYNALLKTLGHDRNDKEKHFQIAYQLFQELRGEEVESSNKNVYSYHGRAYDNNEKSEGNQQHENNEQKIVKVFPRPKPGMIAFGVILSGLSKMRSVEAAKTAESLLNELEMRWFYEEIGKKDRIQMEQQEKKLSPLFSKYQPTVYCYSACIFAWSRSRHPNAHAKAESIFQRLVSTYEKSNRNPKLCPNPIIYNGLIDSFINTDITFHNNDNANRIDVGGRVCDILTRMENHASTGLCTTLPNSIVYTKAIVAQYKNSINDSQDCAEFAESMYDRMAQSYQNGNTYANPKNNYTLTSIIQAWSRSSNMNKKAEKAYSILKTMIDEYKNGNMEMKPNHMTFNAVLNACAYTQSDDEKIKQNALRIAFKTMELLRNGDAYGKPIHITYQSLLRVVVNQLSPSSSLSPNLEHLNHQNYSNNNTNNRAKLVEAAHIIFKECYEDGQVHPLVLKALRLWVPEIYRKLPLDPKNHHSILIPEEWRKNVVYRL